MPVEHMHTTGGPEDSSSRPPVLEFRNVVKSFAGQVVVNDVSIGIYPGQIHGLVGENGAGKTTLVKVLAGEYQADSGEIRVGGEALRSRHPAETTEKGIGFVHQIPALVTTLSVAENVSLGQSFTRGRLGLISWSRQHQSVRPVLERVGLGHIDSRKILARLSIAERQLVALARILTIKDLRVVVFDEVTAPLTEHEVERLFTIIRELRSDGVGIVYISHRLAEVLSLIHI